MIIISSGWPVTGSVHSQIDPFEAMRWRTTDLDWSDSAPDTMGDDVTRPDKLQNEMTVWLCRE